MWGCPLEDKGGLSQGRGWRVTSQFCPGGGGQVMGIGGAISGEAAEVGGPNGVSRALP